MPICLTDNVDAARELAAAEFGLYGIKYTAYRAVFDRQGVVGVAPLVAVGDEAALRAELGRYSDAGVTDFSANVFGTPEQRHETLAFLGDLPRDHASG